jgi:hypothetical protein
MVHVVVHLSGKQVFRNTASCKQELPAYHTK